MYIYPVASLDSIQEEDPINQHYENINSKHHLNTNYFFNQTKEFQNENFGAPFSEQYSPEKELISQSALTPYSPLSPFSYPQMEQIEQKKFQILQKYKNLPNKQAKLKLFQNQLGKKTREQSSNFYTTKSLMQIGCKRNKSRHSSLTLPNSSKSLVFLSQQETEIRQHNRLNLNLDENQRKQQMILQQKLHLKQQQDQLQNSTQNQERQRMYQNYIRKEMQLKLVVVLFLFLFGFFIAKLANVFL